jgi:dTDP-4-amino-4,6-dideoxygalactose transaminase
MLVQWGLRPVFVDIDPDTLTIDPQELRKKVAPQARLVMATHMFGNPADMRSLREICTEFDLPLFEDCAHGVGSRDYRGQVGNVGDGALFSFGPQKLLTCFGGGMLAIDPKLAAGYQPPPHPPVTAAVNSTTFFKGLLALGMTRATYRWTIYPLTNLAKTLAERGYVWLRDLAAPPRDLGTFRFHVASRPPFKRFMPRMCAKQLRRLGENVARRRAAVAAVKQAVGRQVGFQFLDEDKFGTSNGSYFGVYVPDNEAFAAFMLSRGVEVEPHQFYNCASLLQFREFACFCPNAQRATEQLARLPSYPDLSRRDVERIARAMLSYACAPAAAPDVEGTATC